MRVTLALKVATFFHGRNSSTASAPETPMVLAASPLVQCPT